jgi:hypothetical protein
MKNDGRFKKGNIPWNKELKGIHLSPKSEFKADGSCSGTNSASWKGGIQDNKRDGKYLWTSKGQRVRLARANYIKKYGEIPKGFVIYHIDGDKDNDDISNLEAISRAELIKRNRRT